MVAFENVHINAVKIDCLQSHEAEPFHAHH
jgi:hypothetical protein